MHDYLPIMQHLTVASLSLKIFIINVITKETKKTLNEYPIVYALSAIQPCSIL